MLKPAYPAQTELEMVTLEQLVPKDHLLRLLDQHIRFDFIREATQHLYCENNGRPAIDPVVLFKMLFIGYLFGIRSELPGVNYLGRSASIILTGGSEACWV